MKKFEDMIVSAAREQTGTPWTYRDLREWSTDKASVEENATPDEVTLFVEKIGVYAAFFKTPGFKPARRDNL